MLKTPDTDFMIRLQATFLSPIVVLAHFNQLKILDSVSTKAVLSQVLQVKDAVTKTVENIVISVIIQETCKAIFISTFLHSTVENSMCGGIIYSMKLHIW